MSEEIKIHPCVSCKKRHDSIKLNDNYNGEMLCDECEFICIECHCRIERLKDDYIDDGLCEDCGNLKSHLDFMKWVELSKREMKKNKSPYIFNDDFPEMGIQTWDQCDKCGCEPVYTPLYLCEKCWPKKGN